jgi:apolipoprotein N-acyltransferase
MFAQLHLATLPAYVRAMDRVSAIPTKYPRWIALIAGGVSATGFAPLNFWPLTLICLALLMRNVARAQTAKRAFLIGWMFGLGHFTIGNNWIAKAFTFQSNMPEWLGWCAVPLIAVYLAVYPGLAASAAWWISQKLSGNENRHPREGGGPSPDPPARSEAQVMDSRLRGNDGSFFVTLPFILAFAGCWIITEWLRSWVFTGFPWNPLSAVLLSEHFHAWLPVVGTYGSSALVILTAGAIGQLAARQLKIGAVLSAFVAMLWFSSIHIPVTPPTGQRLPNLTVVQPNISQTDRNSPNFETLTYQRLAKHSTPKAETPRLILWPESAIPWYLAEGYPYRYYQFQPGENPLTARAVLGGLMNPGDLLLTGNDRLEFDKQDQLIGARNAVVAMTADGKLLGSYDKAHLVPYGEYLALRWLLEPLGAERLVPGTLDFWPGPGPRTLELPFDGRPIKVGVQICYEMIFSGQVVDRKNRPEFIFNPSNDAWYGAWGPPQHLAQTRLRAIEEGLPVVRSTPTGISAIIDANGRIVKSLPLGKAGRIDGVLPKAKAPTLFARYGNILPLGFAAFLIALSLLPLARRRASR